jgi:hypothetical protein
VRTAQVAVCWLVNTCPFKGRGMIRRSASLCTWRRDPHDRLESDRSAWRALRQAIRGRTSVDADADGRHFRLAGFRVAHAIQAGSGSRTVRPVGLLGDVQRRQGWLDPFSWRDRTVYSRAEGAEARLARVREVLTHESRLRPALPYPPPRATPLRWLPFGRRRAGGAGRQSRTSPGPWNSSCR